MNDVKSITNQLRKIHYAYIVPTLNTHKYGTRYPAIENNNVCKYGKCIESIFFSTYVLKNRHANTWLVIFRQDSNLYFIQFHSSGKAFAQFFFSFLFSLMWRCVFFFILKELSSRTALWWLTHRSVVILYAFITIKLNFNASRINVIVSYQISARLIARS